MATATQKSLTVRHYRPEDEDAVIDLLKMSLGESEVNLRTPEFWRWKHINNPFGPSYVRVSCDESGQIAGLRAFMQWGLKFGQRNVRAVRAVDTSTHPNFRRMGIFSTLTKKVVEDVTEDGVDLIFNTPNQLSMPGYLKMGWHYVGALQPMIKVLNYPRFAWGLANYKLKVNNAERYSEDSFFKGHVDDVGMLLKDENPLNELISRSAALNDTDDRLVTVRSAEYLGWRYADHPNLTYYSVNLENNGELLGSAIFRTNTRFGLKEIVLTELLVARPDDKLCGEIIKQIISAVKADYMVAYFKEGSFVKQTLRKNGFRPVPKMGMDFTSRRLNSNIKVDPYILDNWDLTIGDIELF